MTSPSPEQSSSEPQIRSLFCLLGPEEAASPELLGEVVRLALALGCELHARIGPNRDLLRASRLPFFQQTGLHSGKTRTFGPSELSLELSRLEEQLRQSLQFLAAREPLSWSLDVSSEAEALETSASSNHTYAMRPPSVPEQGQAFGILALRDLKDDDRETCDELCQNLGHAETVEIGEKLLLEPFQVLEDLLGSKEIKTLLLILPEKPDEAMRNSIRQIERSFSGRIILIR